MADNQVTEKEQLKANSQADGADSKTTLSHEAFDNAVKQAQAAGASGASGKDLHVSEQAKGGSVESLPGIILHGGADKSQQGDANHSKQGPADNGKHGGSEQLNQKLDAKNAP